MQKHKRILSVFLSFVILAVCVCSFSANAVTYPMNGIIKNAYGRGVAKIYSLPGTTGHEASEADKGKSQYLCDLSDNEKIKVLGEALDGDGDKWYKINYGANFANEGYAYSAHVVLQYEYQHDPDFETELALFPDDYKDYLRTLHAIYPNWVFVADKLSMSFDEAVAEEYKFPRKLVNMTADGKSWRSMGENVYDWNKNEWALDAGNWTGASREVICYYMDPRNFLNANDIYMFLQQSYDPSTQVEDKVTQMVQGTFLANGYTDPNDTYSSYVKVIMDAAKASQVNPYILTATIILEQGVNGTSGLISGKHPSYPSCYNFFNFKASGNDVVKNGLAYAHSQGWTTRSKSIIEGAKKYAQEYINVGQDTYYYKDFNVVHSNPNYNHQYAQSIYDARSSSARVRSMFINDTNSKLVFRIPVYTSISSTVYPMPPENDNLNNYYLSEMKATGLSPEFSMYNQSYTLSVSGDSTLYVNAVSGATIVSASSVNLSAGSNTVEVVVRAQTGYTNAYTVKVNASQACTLTISTESPTGPTIVKGDLNGDGGISVTDLAQMKLYTIGKIALSETALKSADTNGDGKISTTDLAQIKLHLVGKINLLA